MRKIPSQKENPKGLHTRYHIKKVVPMTRREQRELKTRSTEKLIDVDPGSEYFVLRLDKGGRDKKHIAACRQAVHAYANAIEEHLPQLAKDLRRRYPLHKKA